MLQRAGHRRHAGAARNQNTGIAVTKKVHVPLLRKSVLLQGHPEPPGEGAGRHRVPTDLLSQFAVKAPEVLGTEFRQ